MLAPPVAQRLAVRQQRAMSSRLRLTTPSGVIDRAWQAVVARFALSEAVMTRFAVSSPLSAANRAAGSGRWTPVPPELRRALVLAHRAYRRTEGRFDPRIIGALEALGDRAGISLPLSPAELHPGEPWLEVDAHHSRVRLAAAVDLGGIGKGIALADAARALERQGITDYLLDAGGDLLASGRPPGAAGWRIAIEHPDRELPAAVVQLPCGAALSTSSVRVRSWQSSAGELVHHLLDPATGQPATALRAVTVLDPSPVWAEAWSTAGFVAGRGVERLLVGRAAWWIDANGVQAMSPAARACTVWC
jgi:thiamine biosynthesis lipoprotein